MMRKLLLLLLIWIYPIVSFSAIDEFKTDIYYGNGILTSDPEAREAAALLAESIESLYSSGMTPKY